MTRMQTPPVIGQITLLHPFRKGEGSHYIHTGGLVKGATLPLLGHGQRGQGLEQN